jgi:hypothetical protein
MLPANRPETRARSARADKAEQAMQRWLSILLGIAAVALAGLVAFKGKLARSEPDRHAAETDAALAPAMEAGGPLNLDGGDLLGEVPYPAGPDTRIDNGPSSRMPNGAPVPPLPDTAPRQIRIGVVLVTFAGAQGAPPGARPKKEALELASKLMADAKQDFHGAVVRGDTGSIDDVGRMPRGVLELATEYTLFTMPVGAVSDPLETPRGFWVAKRIE